MSNETIINIIKKYFEDKPVQWVGIFGSLARNEMSENSDVDIALQFEKNSGTSLFEYVKYKQDLEEMIGRKVDMVTYKYIRPRLKKYVDEDLVIILEKEAA